MLRKKSKLKEMARRLAAEKAKTKSLRKKLRQKKKEYNLLFNSIGKQPETADCSSTDGSTTFGLNGRNRLSSTRNSVGTGEVIDQDEPRENQESVTSNTSATDQDASQCYTVGRIRNEDQNESQNNNEQDGNNTDQTNSRFLSSDDESRINFARNMTKANQNKSQSTYPRIATGQEESRFLLSMNQLSVASINVPECKPTEDGDIHRQTFELWKDLLVDSMSLAGINDEVTMFTVFKVKAGVKLLEIFRNTKSQDDDPDPQTQPFSNAMHRLKSYFGSGSDVMLMRRKLALMAQRADETNLMFITRVGSTARLCGYEDGKEFEEIVATIAEHARDKEIRTTALKMLSKKGCFTDLVDKVREIESIKLNEEYVMRKQEKVNQATVAAISVPYQRQQRFPERYQTRNRPYQRPMPKPRAGWRPPQSGYLSRNETIHSKTKCWRCDSVFHSPDECNAIGKICNNCGVRGHIRRACHDGIRRAREQQTARIREEPLQQIAMVENSVEEAVEDRKVGEIIES